MRINNFMRRMINIEAKDSPLRKREVFYESGSKFHPRLKRTYSWVYQSRNPILDIPEPSLSTCVWIKPNMQVNLPKEIVSTSLPPKKIPELRSLYL